MASKNTKVGEAHVDIVANLSGLKADLAKVKSQMGSIGGSAGGLAMKLTALFTGIGAAFAVFSAVLSVLKGIMRLLEKIVSFVVDVLKAAFNILKSVITGVFDAIVAGAKAAFAAMQRLGGFIYKSIRIAADFRHEMTEVGAVLSASAADIKRLSDTALELGKKTEFMASEAASAMQVMARAGLDVNTIIKETGTVIDFATANNIGLAQSATALLGITRGFGIELKFLGGVADIVAKTAKSSSQDITMMQEAMKNVASVAGAVGIDIREVGAALGILANKATVGSLAGSRLRQMLVRLMLPETTASFEDMGIALRDSFNQMRPLSEIIKDFNAIVPAAQRADKAVEIFGGRSSLAFIMLSSAGGKAVDEMVAKISKSQGTVQMMAKQMRSSVEASFRILGSSWEAFQIAVGDIFGPATLGLNIFLSDTLNLLTHFVKEWTPWMQTQIKSFFDWVIKEVPAVLKSLLGTIHFFWDDIGKGFTSLMNFFGGKGGFFGKLLGLDAIREGAGPMEGLFTVMLNLFSRLEHAWVRLVKLMKTLFKGLMVDVQYGAITAIQLAAGKGRTTDIRKGMGIQGQLDRGERTEASITPLERIELEKYATYGFGGSDEPGFGLSEKYSQFLTDWEREKKAIQKQGESTQDKLTRPDPTTGRTPLEQAFENNAETIKELFAAGGKGTESEKWADMIWKSLMDAYKKMPDLPPMPTPPPPAPPPAGGPPPGTGALATTGTISTVFGAMKVAVNDEVRLLRQIVRWNKMIATNTRTQTLI